MTIEVLKATGDATEPQAASWAAAKSGALSLVPVPLDAQPNEYIRTSWAGRAYGTIPEVYVAAVRDEAGFHVRLEWDDPSADEGEFPDAAAVYFSRGNDAPAQTIGAEASPVTLWYWRSTAPAARVVEAAGPGVFVPVPPADDTSVNVAAALTAGRWSVSFTGPISTVDSARKIGVALWNGTNDERAGLAAVTPEWVSVEIPD